MKVTPYLKILAEKEGSDLNGTYLMTGAIVMPGLTEASDRRYPLQGASGKLSKHCAMDPGSEAGKTIFSLK